MVVCDAAKKPRPLKMPCQYYVKKKNRLCKMTVKEGEIFCGQHMVVDSLKDCNDNTEEIKHPKRVACPYDNKHSCYVNKLQKHMAVCNSRPRENPPFIIPGINCGDQNIKRNCRKLGELSMDELTLLMQKIESVYNSK